MVFASSTMPRLCISSTSGGGGKTFLSLGLGRAFAESGRAVQPFKKGPDFIDAAWLTAACGRECTNIDPFFLPPEALGELFAEAMGRSPGALAIIEGNRGLYDGLNETGDCSTAQVARILRCPILLCLNCTKATRTMAAVIRGLTAFEQGLNFAGVVLNQVGSSRHETSLRRALEANVDLPVLGAIPRTESNLLPERHMGIASQGTDLAANREEVLTALARTVRENCDLSAILSQARMAPPLPSFPARIAKPSSRTQAGGPVVGYVRDEALWFYYPENLRALRDAGCELRPLSLFSRQEDWQGLHGLYLGGGFPEDFASEIGKAPQLEILRRLARNGLPIYAECGGLIILCQELEHGENIWPMAAIIPAKARWHKRPVGLGYVSGEICGTNAFYPLGLTIRGHEFHHCSCSFVQPSPSFCLRLSRGAGLTGGSFDGYAHGNLWASFTHIFAPALPVWATSFASLASQYREIQE